MILSVKSLTAGLLIAISQIDPTPVDQQRAEMYFREAKDLCDRDGGRLEPVGHTGPAGLYGQITEQVNSAYGHSYSIPWRNPRERTSDSRIPRLQPRWVSRAA